jgi:hypothetical protein
MVSAEGKAIQLKWWPVKEKVTTRSSREYCGRSYYHKQDGISRGKRQLKWWPVNKYILFGSGSYTENTLYNYIFY